MPSNSAEFMTPKSVDEALALIQTDEAIFLGGGTSTALLYKTRLIEPSRVVWLGSITELSDIEITDNEVRIGSMASMESIAGSSRLKGLLPGLVEAAGVIGNARVRSMATVGGALAHADPRQDIPPALIAVDAIVKIRNSKASRKVALSEFYQGFLETVLEPDELITELVIPLVPGRKSAYLRFAPTSEGDYPTVGVGASIDFDTNSEKISNCKIVLCGVGQIPIVAIDAAKYLIGTRGSADDLKKAASLVKQAISPHDDERGSAAYKTEISEVITFRTLTKCLEQ